MNRPVLRFRSRTALVAGVSLSGLLATSCGDESKLPANTDDFLANYAAIVSATYTDSRADALTLDTALDALVATPTPPNLDAARLAWVDARQSYLQTEAFRFYGGPIDGIDDFINAWPLNEAHIDYVAGNATAGYVNDTAFVITPAALEAQNLPEGGGESDVAVGWHAIEFLLWGQDGNVAGPGDRPVTDYVSAGPSSIEARRGAAVTTLSELLLGHLDELVAQWTADGAYRTELLDDVSKREAMRRVVYGLSIFSGNELGGERLASINTHDQEDEHSCFSDTTDQDFLYDAIGIENVVLGRYVRTDGSTVTGVGLYDVVHAVDAELADALRDRVHTSVTLATAIQHPFDQEIAAANVAGNARVAALQNSLAQQKVLFDEIGSLLDLPSLPAE